MCVSTWLFHICFIPCLPEGISSFNLNGRDECNGFRAFTVSLLPEPCRTSLTECNHEKEIEQEKIERKKNDII